MSLNLSSKFTWTREQREAAPRRLQTGRNGANVQINDSVGRRAACQTGHCLVTTTARSPRVSAHYLPDEHFLDLLHQRCATTMSEWWIDLVRRHNGSSSLSTQNRSNPPRTPACTNRTRFFFFLKNFCKGLFNRYAFRNWNERIALFFKSSVLTSAAPQKKEASSDRYRPALAWQRLFYSQERQTKKKCSTIGRVISVCQEKQQTFKSKSVSTKLNKSI